MITNIKKFVKENIGDIVLFFSIILACMLSFSLGYIMAKIEEKQPLEFKQDISYNNSIVCQVTNLCEEKSREEV